MLQPGGIDAITEFWNWINDGPGSGGVGLHGDFNMTGSSNECEQTCRLTERGERKRSDYGGERPGTEPPEEWKGNNPVCRAAQLRFDGSRISLLPGSP